MIAGPRSGVTPGSVLDVVGRGCFVIAGGTAEMVSVALEKNLFGHLRRLLTYVRDEYERLHGEGSWPGPDPANIGMHRLAGATLLTDSCNAARAARNCIQTLVATAVEEKMGSSAWALLTKEQQLAKTHTDSLDCFQHLRNIFLNHGATEGAAFLKDALADSLKEFSSYERMSTDGVALIRAAYKELHPGGDYAKGHGKEAAYWRKTTFGSTPWLRLERAGGGRQVV